MENKLITFQQLVQLTSMQEQAQKDDAFNHLVNHEPRAEWLKKYPKFIKVKNAAGDGPGVYMPVQKIEMLLTMLFRQWRWEIKSCKVEANSMVTVGRLHYLNPSTGEWTFHDGVGAAPLQTDAGEGAVAEAMKTNAVQLAAGASSSYALKSAAEHIGRLFGRDLNKPNPMQFKGIYSEPPEPEQEDATPTPPPPQANNIDVNNF